MNAKDIVPPDEGGVKAFPYRDAEGRIALLQARVNMKDGSKHFLRYTWAPFSHTPTKGHWRIGGTRGAEKIPVYNLVEALEKADAEVLIVEGEKTVAAAREIFPQYACVSVLDTEKTDFEWMANRRVMILPDNDVSGLEKATDISERVEAIIIDPAWMAEAMGIAVMDDDGWDVAEIPETDRQKCSSLYIVTINRDIESLPNEEFVEFVVQELGDLATNERQEGWYRAPAFCHSEASDASQYTIFGPAHEGSTEKLTAVCTGECSPDFVYKALIEALDTG